MKNFYDVIHLHSVRRRTNVPKKVLFAGLGEIWPLNVVSHQSYPRSQILAWFRVFWAIVRQNPLTGHFSRRVREK